MEALFSSLALANRRTYAHTCLSKFVYEITYTHMLTLSYIARRTYHRFSLAALLHSTSSHRMHATMPHAYEWINKMNVNELFMHAYEKQKRQVKVKLKSAQTTSATTPAAAASEKSIIENEKKDDDKRSRSGIESTLQLQ